MLSERSKAMQKRAWYREFKDMLVTIPYKRASVQGDWDAVTETYVGGQVGIDTTVTGMFRNIKSSIVDKMNLTMDDRKFTIFQDDVAFLPEENDILNDEWKVLKFDEDPAHVYYNIYVRRV